MYSKNPVPDDPADLPEFLSSELDRLETVLTALIDSGVYFPTLHNLPKKPRTGMIAFFASGIAGPSAGLYEYNTSWTKL